MEYLSTEGYYTAAGGAIRTDFGSIRMMRGVQELALTPMISGCD
jgi:hypothetical protein